jgi:hypothetical protein
MMLKAIGEGAIVACGGQQFCPARERIGKFRLKSTTYTDGIGWHSTWRSVLQEIRKEGVDVKPMAAALTGALIAGVGVYAIGARAQDQLAMNAALPGNVPISYFASPQPVAQQPVAFAPVYAPAPAPQQVVYRPAAAPRQTISRTTEPRIVSQTVDTRPARSKTKTALVIGGSAASGAGVGAMVGGKKGALIGAALGGGAASIYEATRR